MRRRQPRGSGEKKRRQRTAKRRPAARETDIPPRVATVAAVSQPTAISVERTVRHGAVPGGFAQLANILALPGAAGMVAASAGTIHVAAAHELMFHLGSVSPVVATITASAIGVYTGCQTGRWFSLRARKSQSSAAPGIPDFPQSATLDERIAASAAAIATTLFALAGALAAALLATLERYRAALVELYVIPAAISPLAKLLPPAVGLIGFHATAAICCTIFASWSFAMRHRTRDFQRLPVALAAGFMLGTLWATLIPNHDLRLVLVALPAFIAAVLIALVQQQSWNHNTSTAAIVQTAAPTSNGYIYAASLLATIGWTLNLWNSTADPLDAQIASHSIVAASAGLLISRVLFRLFVPLRSLMPQMAWSIAACVWILSVPPADGGFYIIRIAVASCGVAMLAWEALRRWLTCGVTPPGALYRASVILAAGCVLPAMLLFLPAYAVHSRQTGPSPDEQGFAGNTIARCFLAGIEPVASCSMKDAIDIDASGAHYELIRLTGHNETARPSDMTLELADRVIRRSQTALLDGGRFMIELPNPSLVRAAVEAARAGRIPQTSQLYYVRAYHDDNRLDTLMIGSDIPAFVKRAESLSVRSTVVLLRGTRHLEALCEASDEALLNPELRHWKR